MRNNGIRKLLREEALRLLGLDLPIDEWAAEEGIADEEIADRLRKQSASKMAAKAANYGAELMRLAEKSLLLQLLDQTWKEHLLALDHLRQGIGLRAYGQKDPLNEYKREAFDMFEGMLDNLWETVTSVMCHLELSVDAEELAAMEQAQAGMDRKPAWIPPSQTARWRWRVSSTCTRRRKCRGRAQRRRCYRRY